MSKDSILKRLNNEWDLLQQSFSDLSDAALLKPNVMGEWSVRDILTHITTWDEECRKNLPLILKKQKTPLYSAVYGGIDEYNRLERERKRGFSLRKVKREFIETHRRLMEFLAGAPESAFLAGSRFQRRLREDTYAHYPEHARAILDWKTKNRVGRN